MPSVSRAFAYHSGSQLPHTLQYGNLSVQNIVDPNWTATGADWFQGPEENSSPPSFLVGYASDSRTVGNNTYVASPNAVGFRRFSSDYEMLYFAQRLSGTAFDTPNDAMNYLQSTHDYWSNYTDTLIFSLDANNLHSYDPNVGGAIWYDLSALNIDFNLRNGVSWSTVGNGSYFTFDGTNQYAHYPATMSNYSHWTIEVAFRITSSLNGRVSSIICNQYDGSSNLNFSIGTNNAPTDYRICAGFFDGAWHNTAGFYPALNTWHHVVAHYDGTTLEQYVDGGMISGNNIAYSGAPQSGGEIRLMRRWDSTITPQNLIPGDLGYVKLWEASPLQPSELVSLLYNKFLETYY
jgi:hypothetical protein